MFMLMSSVCFVFQAGNCFGKLTLLVGKKNKPHSQLTELTELTERSAVCSPLSLMLKCP